MRARGLRPTKDAEESRAAKRHLMNIAKPSKVAARLSLADWLLWHQTSFSMSMMHARWDTTSRRAGGRLGGMLPCAIGLEYRMPAMAPGPWAGTMVDCTKGLEALVTQAKWDKGRSQQVTEIATLLEENPTALPRERLKQIRGFLVYLSRTYPDMVPYLKGVHLTLDSWRAGRNSAGWKLRGRELLAAMEEGKVTMEQPENAPSTARAVDRLATDLQALRYLMESDTPPTRD